MKTFLAVAVLLVPSAVTAGSGDRITVCHSPPGSPGMTHTIVISEWAVHAHLAHGDLLGVCSEVCEGPAESVPLRVDPNEWPPGGDPDPQDPTTVPLEGTINCNPGCVEPAFLDERPDCSLATTGIATMVASVVGDRWGPCVPVTECRPIMCLSDDHCPGGAGIFCDRNTNRCVSATYPCGFPNIPDAWHDCPACPPGTWNVTDGLSCYDFCALNGLCG